MEDRLFERVRPNIIECLKNIEATAGAVKTRLEKAEAEDIETDLLDAKMQAVNLEAQARGLCDMMDLLAMEE